MDRLLNAADSALRTLFASPRAGRPMPVASGGNVADAGIGESAVNPALDAKEARLSAALMRVNHVGEVCAQALYTAQAAVTRNPQLRKHFEEAAREETDHLAWTRQRLDELGSRPSLLNPLWYTGAFGIGLVAGKLGGDKVSLGFVVETERQVEAHLQSHLERLPAGDFSSRAIVAQMKEDEARHAVAAENAGATLLPAPVRGVMKAAARVMTATAQYI